MEASLTSHFHATSPTTPLKRPVYDLSLPKKGHIDVEILTYPNQDTIKTCLYYKRQPKPIGNDLASCRQYFLNILIHYMLSERFDKISSKPSTPYEHLHFGHIIVSNLLRYYTLGVWVKQDRVEETIKSLLEEKERILRYGWTDSEVEMAKRFILSYFEKNAALEHSGKPSSDYAYGFSKHFLAREAVFATSDQWRFSAVKKMLPAITTKDLTNATKDYFAGDDLTIVVLASNKDKLPSKEKICKIVCDVKKSKILPSST